MSKKTRFRIGFFFVVVVTISVVAFLASGSIFHSEAAIPDDRLEEITLGDLSLSVVATGSIVPVATVEIKSKASGLIKQIMVEDGDLVQEGQILAELDKELLQAYVRELEANLLAAVARRQEAESVHASAISMKRKIGMDLDNLDDKVEYHKKQVQRYQLLFEEKLIPHSELETREREFHDAGFVRESLRSELLIQDSRIDATQKAISRVSAEVSQAEATLDRARENLRHATIRSPLKATVLKRHIEVGDAVSSILQLGSQATLIFTLGDMNEVFFEGRVDETDIGKVFDSQQAKVKVDAFRDQPFQGNVIRIAPLGVEEDNVIGFEVRVSLLDPENILRAQMSANAEIIVEEKHQIKLIPEAAVIYGKNKETFAEVYAPDTDSQKERVTITIGISNGSVTEVVSGLQAGQKVVRVDTGGIL